MLVKGSAAVLCKSNIMSQRNNAGFTLVELVLGIVVFSVAMVMILSVVMPQAKRGIDPIWQVRSITLAQSLLNEITSKAFDENSITASGRQACSPCSSLAQLGSDGEVRSNFDDIDDFTNLNLEGVEIADSSYNAYSSTTGDLFLGFQASIEVFYDANFDGIADTNIGNQKLIKIIVTTPDGEPIPFSTYRTNF